MDRAVRQVVFAAYASEQYLTLSPRRFFLKDGAQSRLVEPQVQSVFLRELLDLRLSIFFVQWPDALQFVLVNCTMSPFPSVQYQLASDSGSENFHIAELIFLGEGFCSGCAIFVNAVNRLAVLDGFLLVRASSAEIVSDDSLRRKEILACVRILYLASMRKTADIDVTAVWRERTSN